jgi:ABC-2 type transport system ATP-binding protein
MPAISFQGVTKVYQGGQGPFRALDGVSFDIAEGEFFGLLGPNGAGKTTLISILAGLARATEGRVTVMGHDVVSDFAQARHALGIVPQELVFDPFFSVRETLRIQSGYFGVRHNDDWIDEVLAGLGLADKANANMRQLSGGMKRRVLVAQALVHRPPVIVLDEPTAGVDVELRQTLWQFIARLNQQGHTVLLTTHYLEEAEALCGRIAMLKRGQIVALDRTSNLLHAAGGSMLRFKTDDALPPALQARARVTGRIAQVSARDAADVEAVLAQLRAAGVRVEDLEIGRADLEDVFLAIMQGTATPAPARARRCRHERPRTPAAARTEPEFGPLAGARTLFYKEVLRFWKVSFQTVGAPVLTAVLYLLIFGHVLEDHVKVYGQIGYTAFLIPGLVMMSVLQNAFANSSSSLIQSKITGNLVFLLLTPLSHWAWFLAYVGAAIVRGLVVGLGVLVVTVWFAPPGMAQPLWCWPSRCWARA